MSSFPALALLAVAAAMGWFLFKPPAIFVIRIREGRPVCTVGVVTPAFLAAVGELCADCRVQVGEIRGVGRGRRIALWFSRGLPPAFRQRLRNWWVQSGWSARPRRR